MTTKELKANIRSTQKEYTKYRDIFQKRVKRASAKGYKQAQPYLKGESEYQLKISEIKELPYIKQNSQEVYYRDLQRRLKELKQLVFSGTASISREIKRVSERDKKVLSALHSAGYEHITKSTLSQFGRFMDQMRELYGKKLPASEEMVEFFDSLKYNTKRQSTRFLVDLWKEYEKNGYDPDDRSIDLFAT